MARKRAERPNVGDRIVRLIQENLNPYLSPALEAYVGLPVACEHPSEDGTVPRIHVRMTHETVKNWVLNEYYETYAHEVLPKAQVEAAIDVAKAQAAKYGKKHDIPIRHHYDREHQALYIDLGRPDMLAAKVTPGHWELVVNQEVNFRRPLALGELPLPTPPGTGHICELRKYLNCPGPQHDANFYKMVAWLLGCFMPSGDYPVLVLNGSKGSGKSSISRLLRNLVDPSEADLLQPPKDQEAIALRAFNSWVVAYDNLTSLDGQLSDNLCRLATGSVLTKRQLYTDDGEVIWKVKRPALINGIQRLVAKDDLSQRALVVNLPHIPETKDTKFTQTELDQQFAEHAPELLSALLDVVADGMARLPAVRESTYERYRLGDFHLWVTACERALSWQDGTATAVMKQSQERARADVFDLEPALSVLNDVLWDLPERDDGSHSFTGSAQDLLKRLTDRAQADGLNIHQPALNWPAMPKSLTGRVGRYAVELAECGITQTPGQVRHGYQLYTWCLLPTDHEAVRVPSFVCNHCLNGGQTTLPTTCPPRCPPRISPGSAPTAVAEVGKVGKSQTSFLVKKEEEKEEEKGGSQLPTLPTSSIGIEAQPGATPGGEGGVHGVGTCVCPPFERRSSSAVPPDATAWEYAYSLLPTCPNPNHQHGPMTCSMSQLPTGIYAEGSHMPKGDLHPVYDADHQVTAYQSDLGYVHKDWANEAAGLYFKQRGEVLAGHLGDVVKRLEDRLERERHKLTCPHPRWEPSRGRFGAPILRCPECQAVKGADVPRAA